MKRILFVVGARPNFMKVAPIIREMRKMPRDFDPVLVHTGQHYDANMSQVFFDELGLPRPDVNLEVGSGSNSWQTAQIMLRFEPVVLDYKPDWVVVVGDVNSTLACALVSSKVGARVAHVEAGLRSFDLTMPEEINRLLTDQIADLLFTPSPDANENLLREGIREEKIRLVGNVMIDTLVRLLPKARERWPGLIERFGLERYVLVTLHRPSNVDDSKTLSEIMAALTELSQKTPVLFPVHPRTHQRIAESGLKPATRNLQLIEPLGYLDFLALEARADLVLTDSGGVQEETTYLGVPCLTARPNTERPVTVTSGTNRLVESKQQALVAAAFAALNGNWKQGSVPELWDGMAAQRIVQAMLGESVLEEE
jgi:UDP-N-acetylglucosamine 2-epimerase (non-hydrolysing)